MSIDCDRLAALSDPPVSSSSPTTGPSSRHDVEKSHSSLTTSETSATADDAFLSTAGYQRSMPRRFTTISMIALSFDLTGTWTGVSASIGIALNECSSSGVIWSLLVAPSFTFILSLTMAELASSYPVAGAQYFWAFLVAEGPEERRGARFVSHVTAWMNLCGWWLAMASIANLTVAAFNVFGAKFIPLWNKVMMGFSIITILTTFLTLVICSRNHFPSAKFVFRDTTNTTGWLSIGFAFMLSTLNGQFAYLGTDVPAHMAEEIPSPSRNVPNAILFPIFVGTFLAWPLAVVLVASIRDLQAVLTTRTGFPLIEIFFQATDSKAATTLLASMAAVGLFASGVAIGTATSRTIWAISRDGVLPFSNIWALAMFLTAIVTTLYGTIFIGSANVFSSMISAVIIFFLATCAIPPAIVLYRGRDKVLPERYFRIPAPWGTLVYATSVAWCAFVIILACFPVFYPITFENLEGMNWISVLTVFLVVVIQAMWFVRKRNTFRGPKVDVKKMQMRREEGLAG